MNFKRFIGVIRIFQCNQQFLHLKFQSEFNFSNKPQFHQTTPAEILTLVHTKHVTEQILHFIVLKYFDFHVIIARFSDFQNAAHVLHTAHCHH
jgi:hypothetical protein